jgi:hypothetical protein
MNAILNASGTVLGSQALRDAVEWMFGDTNRGANAARDQAVVDAIRKVDPLADVHTKSQGELRKRLQPEADAYASAQKQLAYWDRPLFGADTLGKVQNIPDRMKRNIEDSRKRLAAEEVARAMPFGLLNGELPKDVLPKGDTNLPIGDGTKQKTPSERGGNNFDFRGSRFTIEQKFSDGFDADRIAILSTEQLAKLATKKTSSTLAPASWQY